MIALFQHAGQQGCILVDEKFALLIVPLVLVLEDPHSALVHQVEQVSNDALQALLALYLVEQRLVAYLAPQCLDTLHEFAEDWRAWAHLFH